VATATDPAKVNGGAMVLQPLWPTELVPAGLQPRDEEMPHRKRDPQDGLVDGDVDGRGVVPGAPDAY